ncbi:MAG: hypothetical protein PVI49_12200, partial [Desulfobacterales bacterium]
MVTVSGDCCPHAVIAYIHRATGTVTKAGMYRRIWDLLVTTADIDPYDVLDQQPKKCPHGWPGPKV